MKQIYFILLIVIPFIGYSQTRSIAGVENQYFAVTSVTNGSNTITCETVGLNNLNPGDKVILIQMKGADIKRTSLDWGTDWEINNGELSDVNLIAGRYEYLAVNSVNTGTGEVIFTANLKREYNANQPLQLVKIIEEEYVSVNGTVYAQPWNGSTGGVVAIVAYKKLTLNEDINVDGAGFRGATPNAYSIDCRPSYINDTFYFPLTSVDKAGVKGEGVLSDTFSYMVGMGNALNGGGGGAGYFGGGGGGSNYTNGGNGGIQTLSCGALDQAQGGLGLGIEFYDRFNEPNPYERYVIAMGGGGGSSNEFGTDVASTGGNGGGIIIILTDTLEANSNAISANGQSVTNTVTAGGAGGGGGGVVVLDATYVSNQLNLSFAGGKGGDTETNCSGAGGGGSGGVFWFNGPSLPMNTTVDSSGGAYGIGEIGTCSPLIWGAEGDAGVTLKNYEPILNGFSFNAISRNDTICQGSAPIEIYGSSPKGESPFTFNWLSSTDNSTWTNLSVNTKNYQPPVLYQTTYYTRVVTNGEGVHDTALSVEIFVWDSIENNILQLRDTICYGAAPGTLLAENITNGGDGNYTYIWESRTNSTSWTERTEWGIDSPNPDEASLLETTYYRRTVNSVKVCTNLSTPDTITVLDLIQNNTFPTPDTTICKNLSGGTLTPNSVSGGDGSYSYSWITSTNDVSYTPTSGSDSTLDAGNLSQTTYYKRIVYSGNDDACVDTTTVPRIITVLELIDGNSISSDSTRYCFGDTPNIINGGNLSGGEAGDYRISWWQNNGGGWTEIVGETGDNYQPGSLTDSTRYRRRVISGTFDACIDTSNILAVDVIPAIINNLASTGENICENSKPASFTEIEASEGAGPGTYEYLWLEMTESSSDWVPASTDEGSNTGYSYSPASLTESTVFSRRVLSHICADTSNEISIVVYPQIENNTIEGGLEQYTCFSSTYDFVGSTPTGGQPSTEPNYLWESSTDQLSWAAANGSSNTRDYSTLSLTSAEYFRRVVTSGELEQCKDTTPVVFLQINPLPEGDIVSMIDTLCADSEISIEYNVTGNGPWTFELGDSEIIHSESNIQSTNGQIVFALNQTANLKVLNIIDDSTCYADLSGNTGLVEAKVYEVPVANAGDDFEDCGLSTQLNAVASVGTGVWTTTNGTFEDQNSPNTIVNVSAYGPSSFTWTETNWRECVDQDVVNVMLFEQPVDIDAGEDISLQYEFETELNALATDVGEGFWQFTSGSGVFDDSTNNNTFVTVDEVGEYMLRWSIRNGVCETISDSILLTVLDLELYGGFSPNADGVNDMFNIDLAEGNSATFIILDKNGRQVKRIEGVGRIEWDGTNEGGVQIPPGTYYYILKEEGNQDRTGYIELRR